MSFNVVVMMPTYDAILILGGGVREGGELPPWVASRFELALARRSGETLVCLSAGTWHRQPPLENGFPISESVAGARYLMNRGVDAKQIRIENASYDTIGNAYFTKLLHVDPSGWQRLLVITSEFHMPRTRSIFDWVFGFEKGRYKLEYAASPDPSVGIVHKRRDKEKQALAGLLETQRKILCLRELHEWVFTEHAAYSADGRRNPPDPSDPDLLF